MGDTAEPTGMKFAVLSIPSFWRP
eukprot:COSAG06_NODE_43166_length_374_cov_1.309091_2_plen_23_part_01